MNKTSNQGKIAIPIEFFPVAGDGNGVPNATHNCSSLCRGLLVRVAGVLDVTMRDGVTRTGLPFIAGINPGEFVTVLDSTAHTDPAAAQGVWEIV